jgi:serine/threonine-protein kinase
MIGQIIGNYKIEEKLGEGGMGAVYKGVDTMLDREVAIKALRPELASQNAVVERFRSEAVTLAKLNHANIATLYTMFRQGDELYMVLEFVRGETLDNILQRRGALPAEEAVPVFSQVLDGIDHAHELGIVHRDIKPANMMLTEKGTLKVLDFGIARLLGSARMTRAGNIIGTLEYMAPEQVRGQETDGRSDIYALGMMLYEVLTGQLPFQTENEFELMKLQTEVVPRPPREINPAIPAEVESAIMKAVSKDPAQRFQTAGEFREVLLDAGFSAQGTMHGLTGTHRKPATHLSRPSVAEAVAANGPVIKETRLGTAETPPAVKETRLGTPATPAGIKETRLGVANSPAAVQSAPAEAPASFFSKLTWIHYAAAGVVLMILMGVVIAVPVAMALRGGADEKPETTTTESKSEPEPQKPTVVAAPETQQPAQSAPPIASPSGDDPTLQAQQPGELTPIESKKDSKPAQVAEKPAAPKKQAPAKPKGDSGPSRAEKLLTGN